jgi:cytochrome c oxidase subunit 1
MFAAFYYWIGKLFGFQYSEFWGWSHFLLFTIAINIVFFPMHFLGLAGMPRRIPDYALGYSDWNLFMSLGSIFTVFSVFLFLYILAARVFTVRVSTFN